MLHGWHSQYSSFRVNEQEISHGSFHLSKEIIIKKLYYYENMEMVIARRAILDSVYLMCVNLLLPYWKRREWTSYWIKDSGNTYRLLYSYSFSSFVLHWTLVWMWICKFNEYCLFELHHISENHPWMITKCHPCDGWIIQFCSLCFQSK